MMLLSSLVLTTGIALARPAVTLHLVGTVTQKGADGKPVTVAVESIHPTPGETIAWTVTARNTGDSAASRFVTVERIPAGTTYVAGSAKAADTHVQFSLDGGKTWSAKPMLHVHTAAGDVLKAADPSAYTAVRWVTFPALAPKATETFSYEVRVK